MIGSSQRHDFTNKRNANAEPGPGKYNPEDKYTKFNGETWRFGTEKQRPGTSSKSPGPGQYSPEINAKLKSSPKYRIGTAPRGDFTIKKGGRGRPGPGNYTPSHALTKNKSETWMFGSERRPGTSNKMVISNPGPNHYNVPSELTNGPKYYMGEKLPNEQSMKRAKNSPGPASYQIREGVFSDANMIKEPNYKIGSAQRLTPQ